MTTTAINHELPVVLKLLAHEVRWFVVKEAADGALAGILGYEERPLVGQSQLLADALQAAGVDVRYDLLKGVGHGDSGSTPVFESAENVQVVLAFLAAKVK